MATRGYEKVTLDQAQRMGRQPVPPKPSKYRNVKTTVDGIVFDSAKEAKRYCELKALARIGQIRTLCLQPRFPLYVKNPNRMESEPVGAYRGDFSYIEVATGCEVVEDVKGMRTALYKWKKKHVEIQYGIQIREL